MTSSSSGHGAGTLKTVSPSKPSASPASSVGGTSTSGKATYRRPRSLPRVTPSVVSQVLSMKAEGLNDREVGRAIGLNNTTVAEIARKPENHAEIVARRSWLKTRTAQRLEALIEPAWDMAQKAAEQGDAKSFDSATRGLYAAEKISASVAGENQRVQVEHGGSVNIAQEPAIIQLKALIGIITGSQSTQR